ncbi:MULTISPECIES: acyl-ACP--UDP-N-acetylglucosamine O-acyltransferase [unclassified Nitratiruptor]|uniref:acyl-ACP--UDP-N-acetylglucosamine O-acyltransferase n=1 Tax=unclassified Nitratiruptor TaxID=2624044 RepID=UPI001914FFDA|nr:MULTISPECIES: acyl-ACP--UDP-N-acetylglucosamine O-acyltransferase [unclassified Nitratiruptor]BCD59840.1 UDP-N-acetylglucosamine acyltransferase [Nitratiruptor sp. YY08-10]BCD63763.1 UDP-N-acetylglucosamine acyltransferase [Nitratiruptor sp. YY08-14]
MIHPTAIIEEGAKIGKNVTIGPNAYISKDAVIEDGCTIMQGAIIDCKTKIGQGTKIFYNAVIGSIPQDLKFGGEDVELIIGKNNTIREFCLINPGTAHGGGKTIIGDNNLLMGYVHVAHDCRIGNNCILANAATLAGHVELGNNVVIGGMTPIHQFVKIGDFAMIGGASAVSQDIPPYTLAEGNRAKLRGLNLVGLRRNFGNEVVDEIKQAFKKLFKSGQSPKEVAKELVHSSSEHVRNLAEFVLASKRGIPYR